VFCLWHLVDSLIGECPLSGVKRTSQVDAVMSAFDP
jgi:hypothetical protein